MQITIQIDEGMLQSTNSKLDALAGSVEEVLDSLLAVSMKIGAIEAYFQEFVGYELESDQEMENAMGVVTEKIDAALAEAQEQSTVTDGLVVYVRNIQESLADVRADLANAIERGATEEDLASLDEVIAKVDSNTARAAALIVEGTDAEGETPVNPVPEPVPQPTETPGNTGSADPSTAPDV